MFSEINVEKLLTEDPVLHVLSQSGVKELSSFKFDKKGPYKAKYGKSVDSGNLFFASITEKSISNNGNKSTESNKKYYLKIEGSGVEDYVRNLVSSVLSRTQDDISNMHIYNMLPMEKIVINNSNKPSHIASIEVPLEKYLVFHNKNNREMQSAQNIRSFFEKPDITDKQKLQMADILARMLAIHEYDPNSKNFLFGKDGNMYKIDNTQSTFSKYHQLNYLAINDLHYVIFVQETIVGNKSSEKMYVNAISSPDKIKLNKNFFNDENMSIIMKSPIKTALLTTFIERINNLIQMPEEIKNYIFSEKIFGERFRSFSPEIQKDIKYYLKKLKIGYNLHLTNMKKFIGEPQKKLTVLRKLCKSNNYEIPVKPIDYSLSSKIVRISDKFHVNLNSLKNSLGELPQSPNNANIQKAIKDIREINYSVKCPVKKKDMLLKR